jgi:DNA-binding NarL/FixJ family response regulator
MKGGVRILVADDHPLYREALSELFRRAKGFNLIAAVGDLPSALELLSREPCDLVLLDVYMPGMDGLTGISKVRECRPEVKIALISGRIDSTTVDAGLAAGVKGFLPKSLDHDVILATVKLILAGGVYVPHDLARTEAATEEAAPAADAEVLSSRERDILCQLAAGATNKEIGRALGIAEVTVKLHTQRIARKLKVKNRSAAIAKAVKEGLVDLPQ